MDVFWIKSMESQTATPDYRESSLSEEVEAQGSNGSPAGLPESSAEIALLPPESSADRSSTIEFTTDDFNRQWRQLGEKISVFLAYLPTNVVEFFNRYQKPILSLALLATVIIVVKVVLAVLGALGDVPLLSSTFELIGIGYSWWFVNRYLLKASDREQLFQELRGAKQEIVGH
jgi:hypothetical protein